MGTITKCAVTAAVCLVVGTGLGYWLTPTKVVTEVRTERVEVEARNVHTKKTRIKRPDGTTETTVEVVDRTVTREDESSSSKRTETRDNKEWLLSCGVKNDLGNLASAPDLWCSGQRRIIGEIYGGLFGSASGELGAGITLRF